jgi:hypothetical protein
MTTKNIVLLAGLACLEMVCRADSPTLDSTSYPYVGVTLSHYSASSPQQNINVVAIDLAAPGIQFRVTPEVGGLPLNSSGTPYTVTRQFTLDFMTNRGAQIAIDASRYWPTADGLGTMGGSGTPVNLEGVVASTGSVYESFFNAWRAPPPPGISWPALNIGFSNEVGIVYGDSTDPFGHTPLPQLDNILGHQIMDPPMALFNTVSGNYQVVSNGIPITADRLFLANDFNPNPRTAIGFTTNNHLMLVAVDGGGSPWYGMRVMEMGWFMATNLGVFNAINADGGGSTTLALATPRPHLVNVPSTSPSGRAVGANLAVFALPAYVEIANILNGSTFTAPSEIDIAVDVQDRVGTVTNVAFYASGLLLGSQAGGGPFMLAWDNPPGGSYALNAIAMDNAGLNTTSAAVNITVTCSAQPAPPANVSASDGVYCGAVQVSWSASNGATGYDVYRDGHFVANVGTSPYNDMPGDSASHSYIVTATYNCGQSAAGPADIGYAVQVPPPPAAVSASDGTYCGVVQVSWTPSSGAASYTVYRDAALVGSIVGSPFTDMPGDNANHLYTVAAGNGLCTSAPSAPNTGYAGSCAGDFSMSVSPVSQTVKGSTAASYSVTVTASGGFSGTVTFSATGLPNGATQSFSPTAVTGSGSTVLTITAPLGSYNLTVTGTSGSLVHQVSAALVVSNGDFSVSVSPSSRTITAGKSTSYTAKYTPTFGFSGVVTWSVTGLPTGVTGNFTPSGTATVLLTVNSAKTTRSGTYILTLVGTSGTLRHSTTVTLIVR